MTQTGTCLVIKSIDANPAYNTNINNVSVQSKLASLLREFPNIGAVNSSGYSKFAPTQGVKHHIDTNNTRLVRSLTRPLFGTKKKAQNEFKAMLAAGIVSRSEGSPWAAPLHLGTLINSRTYLGRFGLVFIGILLKVISAEKLV